jgi:PAS domain S-box-containing protein
MRYVITYTMITGVAERVANSEAEALDAVAALKAVGAGPITVEFETDGRREPMGYVPLGPASLADVSLKLRQPLNAQDRPPDRRIDPSMQSVSLADARRPDCPLIYVNRGFEHLTGYAREACIGRNCRFLQGPDTDPTAVKRMKLAIAAGEPLILDLLNYRKDGSTFMNRISLKPVRSNSGEITHIVGIQSDITRMLSLQETLVGWAIELASRGR